MSEVVTDQAEPTNNDLDLKQRLPDLYQLLLNHYGPQNWWPAESRFEVIVGAILTQSAAWGNVEKAISNLRKTGVLSAASLRNLPLEELAALIYSSGYFNAKAKKIKAFVDYMGNVYQDSLDKLFSVDISNLRSELLAIHGIGPETADSIILYAAYKPVFVIDAYTRRILSRLGLNPPRDDYASFQRIFMDNLPPDVKLFNEYHALFVRHGKEVCRKLPLCRNCCLSDICLYCQAT